MLSNIRIDLRLGAGFGIVLLLLLAIAALGALQMGKINDGIDDIVKDKHTKESLATDVAFRAMDNEHLKELDRLTKTPKGKELLGRVKDALLPNRAFNNEVIELGLGDKKLAAVKHLIPALNPGGCFITGHCDTLAGVNHGLTTCRPSVYRKAAA